MPYYKFIGDISDFGYWISEDHRNSVCVSHVDITLLTPSCSLLEDRVTRLHGQLQRTQQHLMASSDPGSVDRKVLDDLYEDIHWLILVTGQQQDIELICVSFLRIQRGHFGVWNTKKGWEANHVWGQQSCMGPECTSVCIFRIVLLISTYPLHTAWIRCIWMYTHV